MSDRVYDIKAALRVGEMLEKAIDTFLTDPPDNDFQRGYLSALLEIYTIARDGHRNSRIAIVERLLGRVA